MAASLAVSIIYVPADCGSIIPGKSKAPKAFQVVNVAVQLQTAGVDAVSEYHALESPAKWSGAAIEPSGVRDEDLNVFVNERVRQTVEQALDSNPGKQPPFQLILGGECCMLPGILTAFWRHSTVQDHPKRVGLIYIDADTDLASPTDPNSIGTFAGMTTTHLIRSPGSLESMRQFSRPSGVPVCDASNMVFFGTNMSLPSNTREHFTYLFEHDYKVFSSASVAKNPERQARKALEYLESKVDVIMVHLDVDSIDAVMFPLANVPNFTGVRFEQMMRALAVFLASEKVGGCTVAEVNPDHDPGLVMTGRLTEQLVKMLAKR